MPKEQAKKPGPYVLHLGKPKISAKDFTKSMKKDPKSAAVLEMMAKMQQDIAKGTK
jgi:hypothetical protein